MKKEQFTYSFNDEFLCRSKIDSIISDFALTYFRIVSAFDSDDIDRVSELLSYHNLDLIKLRFLLEEYKKRLTLQKNK